MVKTHGFPVNFPLNQSIEYKVLRLLWSCTYWDDGMGSIVAPSNWAEARGEEEASPADVGDPGDPGVPGVNGSMMKDSLW